MRIFFYLLLSAVTASAAAPAWKTDVLPVFKQHCNGCHNPDKLKADLDLTTFETTMKGGSSGAAVTPGSADSSLLFRVVAHMEEPEMPPKKPKLGDGQLAVIKDWIQGGAIEAPGGTAAKTRDSALAMAVPAAAENADTPPPMPAADLAAAPDTLFSRPAPVVAMAASPRAPLLAVARHGGIALINADTQAVLGALPAPARQTRVLHFSQDGTLLLAAGGHPAQSGIVVVYDIATGKQVAQAGDELSDVVLAAGLSPDRSLLATGGPDKLVRIYSTAGKLLHTIKKHTDWVTALAFSPDGTKLATADRNGGLHLWDPVTGTILYSLAEHQAAITTLSWRADSLILASSGDDGKLILWDTEEGWAAKSLTPHDAVKKDEPGRKTILLKIPGVLSASFSSDGKLVTAGRDNTVRIFRQNGSPLATLKDFPALPTTAVFLTKSRIATGDYQGEIRLWQIDPKEKEATALGTLTPAAATAVEALAPGGS